MARSENILMDSVKSPQHTTDVVDMEMNCVRCRTHLYVPHAAIDEVITSLERTGAAILICVCGQAQLIKWRPPQSRCTDD